VRGRERERRQQQLLPEVRGREEEREETAAVDAREKRLLLAVLATAANLACLFGCLLLLPECVCMSRCRCPSSVYAPPPTI